jgi:alpha-glucosidase
MGLSTALLWAGVSLPFLTSCANIPRTEIPSSTSSGDSPIFTIPASADEGAPLLPNIQDPQAVDAQKVCPGYIASDVEQNQFGFTATLSLAGDACNVYGTDIETLNLEVAYQAQDRLSVNIYPANISPSNQSHYILSEDYVQKPGIDSDEATPESDLIFHWSNKPTFAFTVVRKSTNDVIFSTEGTVLVYENQFIEFVSSLPENYNLYGLGERIHGLRLGNNFTATIYAADIGDPIDE